MPFNRISKWFFPTTFSSSWQWWQRLLPGGSSIAFPRHRWSLWCDLLNGSIGSSLDVVSWTEEGKLHAIACYSPLLRSLVSKLGSKSKMFRDVLELDAQQRPELRCQVETCWDCSYLQWPTLTYSDPQGPTVTYSDPPLLNQGAHRPLAPATVPSLVLRFLAVSAQFHWSRYDAYGEVGLKHLGCGRI